MQRRKSPWSVTNIISTGFLFLMILLILSFSIYRHALGNTTDTPSPTDRPDIPSKTDDPDSDSSSNTDNNISEEEITRLLAELDARQSAIKNREKDLNEKESVLKEKESLLQEQEQSLRSLMEVRTNIIEELVDKFSQSNLVLEIDSQTGAIRFSDGIFFDSGKDVIKSNGESYLKEFIPAYFSILLSETNRNYIAEIIIEGHTDNVGSYIYNLDLSQRRAFAVARYILERKIPNFPYQDIIREYLTANGRSYSQPIIYGGVIDKQKSRRVEFKFRLKDEETIKQMQSIFEGTQQ